MVNDNVEKELRQECEGIKCADRLMSKTLEQTEEQLRRVKAALYFIDHDLEDKENSLRIDRYNSTLKETSLNLSIYCGKSALDASYGYSFIILLKFLRNVLKNEYFSGV